METIEPYGRVKEGRFLYRGELDASKDTLVIVTDEGRLMLLDANWNKLSKTYQELIVLGQQAAIAGEHKRVEQIQEQIHLFSDILCATRSCLSSTGLPWKGSPFTVLDTITVRQKTYVIVGHEDGRLDFVSAYHIPTYEQLHGRSLYPVILHLVPDMTMSLIVPGSGGANNLAIATHVHHLPPQNDFINIRAVLDQANCAWIVCRKAFTGVWTSTLGYTSAPSALQPSLADVAVDIARQKGIIP